MRKFLLGAALIMAASPAMAADVEPVQIYDWSGFYIGLNAGAAWNNTSVDDNINDPLLPDSVRGRLEDSFTDDQTVFTGGGEIGYNWQMDSIVLGLEADFNYLGFDSNRDRNGTIGEFGNFRSELGTKMDWFGTVRGRLGFAFDNVMIFGTGGLAYGNMEADGTLVSNNGDVWKGKASDTNVGWTVGGGIEYAPSQNWVIGAEYLYVDLGSSDFNLDRRAGDGEGAVFDSVDGNADFAFSVVRATAKFKFY